MTEIILILGCYFSNINACSTTGQAYYQYTGIDKMIDRFGRKNIALSYTVTVIGVINEKRMIIPLVRYNNHSMNLEIKSDYSLLTYQKGF